MYADFVRCLPEKSCFQLPLYLYREISRQGSRINIRANHVSPKSVRKMDCYTTKLLSFSSSQQFTSRQLTCKLLYCNMVECFINRILTRIICNPRCHYARKVVRWESGRFRMVWITLLFRGELTESNLATI